MAHHSATEGKLTAAKTKPTTIISTKLPSPPYTVAAVIAMARQRRLIDSARAVFAELHANDFRIAPAVIQAVLERCDE